MLFADHRDRLSVTPCFIVLGDVFSEEECTKIIEIGQETDIEESKILGEEKDANANNILKIRKSKNSFINLSEKTSWIFEKIFQATTFVNENYFHFELNGFNSIQFTEYHGGGDFYDWHLDLPLKSNDPYMPLEAARFRKLSGSLILSQSSEYTGGEFYIDRDHRNNPINTINQSIGSIVFFPSFISHKVNNVTSGIRRSLVFWVEGPKFK
jgi:PKHD-type hydroxylase